MDGVAAVQRVQMLAIIEVPQHGLAVLATAGAQGTIRRQGHGVEIAGVTNVVGLQLAVGQVPHCAQAAAGRRGHFRSPTSQRSS